MGKRFDPTVDSVCGCGDDHCETCFPENAELSDYCFPGAGRCLAPAKKILGDQCVDCTYRYTKLEARLKGLIN